MTFNGVWAPWPGQNEAHSDTYSMMVRPLIEGSTLDYEEHVIARIFNSSGQPVWMTSRRQRTGDGGVADCTPPTCFSQNHTFPMVLFESPFPAPPSNIVLPAQGTPATSVTTFNRYERTPYVVNGCPLQNDGRPCGCSSVTCYSAGWTAGPLSRVIFTDGSSDGRQMMLQGSFNVSGILDWARPSQPYEHYTIMPGESPWATAYQLGSELSIDGSVISAMPRLCYLPAGQPGSCPVQVSWKGGRNRLPQDWRVVRRDVGGGNTVVWAGVAGQWPTNTFGRGTLSATFTQPAMMRYALQHLSGSGWVDSAVSTLVEVRQRVNTVPKLVVSRPSSETGPVAPNSLFRITFGAHSETLRIHTRLTCSGGPEILNQFDQPPADSWVDYQYTMTFTSCPSPGTMVFTAFAANPEGEFGLRSEPVTLAVGGVIPAPSNLRAVVNSSNGQVTLSWDKVDEVASGFYQVWRTDLVGVFQVDGLPVPPASPVVSTTRFPGYGRWRYRVKACLSIESCSSASETVEVDLPLTAPGSVSAAAGQGLIYNLNWSASLGALNGYYEVRQGLSSTGSDAVVVGGHQAGVSYQGTVPTAGTWYFSLRACPTSTQISCSAWTPPVPVGGLVLPAVGTLQAPTVVTVAPNPTHTWLTVQWTPASGVDLYAVEYQLGGGAWTPVSGRFSGSLGSFSLAGPGTYSFRVRGCNASACSTDAAPSAAYSVAPAALPTAPAADVASDQVGAVPGDFRVDESGQADYSIPVFVPPGRGGLQPSLAIHYNSAGGDGQLGTGFSLEGQSSISRCRRTMAQGDGPGPHPEVNFADGPDQTDQYCLDGTRLMLVAGSHGAVGAEYRTEVDQFLRVVITSLGSVGNSPETFEVRSKDGTRKTYGGGNATMLAQVIEASGTRDVVVGWSLASIRDTTVTGNTMTYSYGRDAALGEQWLSEINYFGGHVTLAYSSAPTASAKPQLRYAGGAKMSQTRWLASIAVSNNDNRVALRRYALTYDDAAVVGYVDTHRPRVASVQECAGQVCYPPTTFARAQPSGIDIGPPSIGRLGETSTEGPWRNAQPIDANGDGLLDLLYVKESGKRVRLATGYMVDAFHWGLQDLGPVQFCQPGHSDCDLQMEDGVDTPRGMLTFDFNNDGRDDLLLGDREETNPVGTRLRWRLLLATSTIGQFVEGDLTQNTATQRFEMETVNDLAGTLADVDGDGLPDLIWAKKIGTEGRFVIARMVVDGGQFKFAEPTIATFAGGATGTCELGRLNSLNSERFEVFDANGDGRADLRLRLGSGVCTSLEPRGPGEMTIVAEPAPDPARTPESTARWAIFTSGPRPGNNADFHLYAAWPIDSTHVGDDEEDVRFADVNGDGLVDFAFRSPADGRWFLELNKGNGYDSVNRHCLYKVNGACTALDSKAFRLMDYDGDGTLDVMRPQDGGTTSPRTYAAYLWQGNDFANAGIETFMPNNQDNNGELAPWRFGFDLDGDGRSDNLVIRTSTGSGNGSWRAQIHRPDQNNELSAIAPGRVIGIVNGLGAVTRMLYAPLSDSRVYRRDFTPPAGGIAVFDVASAQYVVRQVKSSAPNVEGGTGDLASVSYRYAGLKQQAGGRGSQGYRTIYSLDDQTGIQTRTEYFQQFPLTGIARSTVSSAMEKIRRPNGSAGEYLDWSTWNPRCETHFCRRACEMVDTSTGMCLDFDVGYPLDLFKGKDLTRSVDLWQVRPLDLRSVGPSATALSPQPVQVLRTYSSTDNYALEKVCTESNAGSYCPSRRTHGEDTTFGSYDPYGNLLGSTQRWNGGSVATVEKTVTSSFTYYDHYLEGATVMGQSWTTAGGAWLLGRLKSSSVTTSRPNRAAITRTSLFEYDTSTGMLTGEHTDPVYTESGGSFQWTPDVGLDRILHTWRTYDSYGNLTKSVACSNHAALVSGGGAACKATTAASTLYLASDPTYLRRLQTTEFDASQHFPWRTYAPMNGVLTITAEVLDRNAAGDVIRNRDANGVVSVTAHGALGRAYFAGSSTGASAVTRFAACAAAPALHCPTGAVYQVRIETSGASPSWAYYDVLGRQILTIAEALPDVMSNPGNPMLQTRRFTASRTGYDKLNRTIEQSQPYWTTDPDDTGASQPDGTANGSVYFTRTQYDELGRAITLTQPDGGVIQTVYDGLLSIQKLPAVQDGLLLERRQAKSALGEIASIEDWGNSSTSTALQQLTRLEYDYASNGELKATRRIASNPLTVVETTVVPDDIGRRLQLIDPDIGTWQYGYDALGGVVQTRARTGPTGSATRCTIEAADGLGRKVERRDYAGDCGSTLEERSTWTYDGPNGKGLLYSEQTERGTEQVVQRTMTYDVLGRLVTVDQTVGAVTGGELGAKVYRSSSDYDQYGRPRRGFFQAVTGNLPQTGETQVYHPRTGQGYEVRDAMGGDIGALYQRVRKTDMFGNVTDEHRAVDASAPVQTVRQYDGQTGRILEVMSGGGSLAYQRVAWNLLGNVSQRKDLKPGRRTSEVFHYDALQRVVSSELLQVDGGGATLSQAYAYSPFGNVLSKPDVEGGDNYVYGGRTIDCKALSGAVAGPQAVTAIGGLNYCYDSRGNQTLMLENGAVRREIGYSSYDLPLDIEADAQRTVFRYGPGRERLQRLDYADKSTVPAQTTHYLGSSEVHWSDDSHLSVKRYVGGVMVLQSTDQPQTQWQYLFFDTQGSVVAQTTPSGDVVGAGAGAMAWDAFGARRNLDGSLLSQAEQWTQNSTGETTRHGYTGHEQLDNSGLVHMNGRIYDPYLARFVQGDPLVEDPYNGQSLNRYSYVMNNPMSLTDPTGFSTIRSRQMYRQAAAMAITMVTGAYASGFEAGLARTTILVSGGFASGAVASGNLKGGVLGAFQAMVNVQIGNTFASADMAARFTSGELYAMHTLTHAVSGGVFSSLNGGKFGHGFVAAGVATAFSPVIERAPTGRVAIAALIGGVASRAVGGKFGSGALTAAFAQAFNGDQQHPGAYGNRPYRRVGNEPLPQDWGPFLHEAEYVVPNIDALAPGLIGVPAVGPRTSEGFINCVSLVKSLVPELDGIEWVPFRRYDPNEYYANGTIFASFNEDGQYSNHHAAIAYSPIGTRPAAGYLNVIDQGPGMYDGMVGVRSLPYVAPAGRQNPEGNQALNLWTVRRKSP